MELLAAGLSEGLSAAWQAVWEPIRQTPWQFWWADTPEGWERIRHFWMDRVFNDRFRVTYFLPLVFVLMLLRGRALKAGIIATGLAFVGYNFGVLYPVFWLLLCLVFYRLTEQFAIEIKREDVLKIGPPLAAIGVVIGANIVAAGLKVLPLPFEWNAWLSAYAPWVLPLGARPMPWEPHWVDIGQHRLPTMVLWDAHLIGTAYFTIRMLHYFSELKRETIPREQRSLLNFMAYLCYAPTLMQGPIERYPRFLDEIETCHARRGWVNVPPALWRFALGLGKVLVSTWYFKYILNEVLNVGGFYGDRPGYYRDPELFTSYWALYGGVFLNIFWLYLEFSGYCDMAAGMSRLLGYRLVENFQMPWVATSLRDFWRRWHISLSAILRDYIYIPLGGGRRRTLFNLCVTFGLCGIWHIPIPKLALWGVLMGFMVWVNQAWVQYVKQLDEHGQGRIAAIRRAWLRLWPLPQLTAWLVTMNAFCLSLLLFFGGWGGVRVFWELIRRPLNALLLSAGVALDLPPLPTFSG